MTGLSWRWVALMATVPLVAGVLVAYPLWRARQTILGNLAGSGLIFGAAIVFMMREHATLDASVQRCLEAGYTCWPDPSAFTRYALYASIGLIEVFVLFAVSLRVETRLRDRTYAPEWRAN